MKTYLPFFTALLLIACKSGNETTQPRIQAISESVYASATVKSKNQYQVYSTVTGLLQEILVTEGDVVKKGDPLMRVRNEPSKLTAYNAKLAAAFADLSANQGKLREAKVTADFALTKMKNDSLLLVRQQNLRAQGVGSQLDLEQRELAYKNSVTNLEVTRLQYRDLRRQLEFASNQSKTNQKISDTQAGDYLIKSDTDGKVYKILKERGEFVNSLNPVAIVGDAQEFLMEMKVDEYDIARIQKGQRVLFTMDSYKGEVFEATVSKIEPLMNEQSRSFTINADFVTKPAVLYPNLSAEANIIIRTKENALTIPRNYLMGDSVVIVNKNEKRKVVIGLKDYQWVEIQSGLTAKDILYKPNL